MSGGGHVLIVGAASNVADAIVDALIDRGCSLTIIDSSSDRIAEAEARLEGENVFCLCVETGDDEEIEEAMDAGFERFGPFDGLAMLVGGYRAEALDDIAAERLRAMLDETLVRFHIVCQAAVERMDGGLSIVCVTEHDAAGSGGGAAMAAIVAASSALADAIAVERADDGVRVNIVAASPAASPLLASEATGPRGRPQRIAEVVSAVVYFLGDESGAMTRQTLDFGRSRRD